ncbi:MAG: hypothetical protein ACE5GC_08780 [Acidimicrobiia bacterium]
MRRLFPTRWAGILAWTGAAVAWSVSLLFALTEEEAEAAQSPQPDPDAPQLSASTTTLAPVPDLPATGLVVIRYTPVLPPPPQEIVRTVSVAAKTPARTAQTTRVKSKGS